MEHIFGHPGKLLMRLSGDIDHDRPGAGQRRYGPGTWGRGGRGRLIDPRHESVFHRFKAITKMPRRPPRGTLDRPGTARRRAIPDTPKPHPTTVPDHSPEEWRTTPRAGAPSAHSGREPVGHRRKSWHGNAPRAGASDVDRAARRARRGGDPPGDVEPRGWAGAGPPARGGGRSVRGGRAGRLRVPLERAGGPAAESERGFGAEHGPRDGARRRGLAGRGHRHPPGSRSASTSGLPSYRSLVLTSNQPV
ncbi:hypothetical protein FHX81_6819 [Saccharothrix saharensis]|uniref:Uncharacterized protein n=1 Tax=Saccharothrix saharensis TaxID=571190 RepID=A0A543JNM6_9PSEU|nr:hypothetical protein FHX81_6819 [Saccharothrix saharensis]